MNATTILSFSKEVYGDEFEKHILEQYKIYVDMADKVSSRRMLANSFFVSIHTAFVAALSFLSRDGHFHNGAASYAPLVALILLCILWWQTVRSYRQLNSGKFKVIHELEKHLPVTPFVAEWSILGEGRRPNAYTPLSNIESWLPFCFGLLYVMLAIAQWRVA